MKKYILLLGLSICYGCLDTDLDNLADPNAAQVLSTVQDYESTLNAAVLAYWQGLHYPAPYLSLASAADHSTSPWLLGSMYNTGRVGEPYGLGDHQPINNALVNGDFFIIPAYRELYRAISSCNDVLKALDNDNLVDDATRDRLTAYALFVRGISYGYMSLLYDRALITTQESDLEAFEFSDFSPYTMVNEQALKDLRNSITITESLDQIEVNGFNGISLDKNLLLQLAHSFIAKFIVHLPRTAAEMENVDWQQVKDNAEKGLLGGFDLSPMGDGGQFWWHAIFYQNIDGWTRLDQRIINMVGPDFPYPFPQEGYTPDPEKLATTDARFANDKFAFAGNPIFTPDRGVYFFSYWKYVEYERFVTDQTGRMPSFEARENLLNLAEAYIRLGEPGAADIINETRVANGSLPPTSDDNPDILQHLFYERYLETYDGSGNPFFDRRRTDDLGSKQFTQMPIPAVELDTWGAELYTFGGE